MINRSSENKLVGGLEAGGTKFNCVIGDDNGDIVSRQTFLTTNPQDTLARERERNISSGNPGLKPMVAWNYDASLTWYIDEASYLSVAGFHKDLSDKSERQTNIVNIVGEDFFVNRPENLGDGSIDGVEIAGQYKFTQLPGIFGGFGLQANYTYVKEQTDGVDEDRPSETYNIVGFFEQGPIQARLAYNYRTAFTESLAANRGQPKMIRAYGQWDASASYDINENFSVFVDIITSTRIPLTVGPAYLVVLVCKPTTPM